MGMTMHRLRIAAFGAATIFAAAARAHAQGTGTIAGTVFDSLRTFAPLRDATVMVTETGRTATTDARGRFRIDSVPAGTYRLTFFYAVLDSLGIGGPVTTVSVAAGAPTEAYLSTPTPQALYRRLCGPPKDQSVAAVVGRVRDVDTGQPLAEASVETFWAEFQYMASTFRRRMFKASTRTGPQGIYILCDVPSDVPVDVTVRSGGYGAGPVTVNHGREVVAHRDFAVSRRDSAARADSTAIVQDSTRIPVGSGVVRGTLKDRVGRPIGDSPVRIVADARETRSRPDGSFTLTGVPAGTRTVEARAIGYGPATTEVDVPTGGAANANVVFDRRAQEMKPITVVGQRPSRDVAGFSERQRQGLGRFLTSDDLERRPASRIGDALLRSMPVTYDMTAIGPEVKMRASGSMQNDSRCVPNWYLDGMYIPRPESGTRQTMLQSIEAMVFPQDIRGIELYNSLGEIPPQFNRFNGCGSIVIWTK
jgi:hypothetical protein